MTGVNRHLPSGIRCRNWEERLSSTEHNSMLTASHQVRCVGKRNEAHTCTYRGVPFGQRTREAIELHKVQRQARRVPCGAPLARKQRHGGTCSRLIQPEASRCAYHR